MYSIIDGLFYIKMEKKAYFSIEQISHILTKPWTEIIFQMYDIHKHTQIHTYNKNYTNSIHHINKYY